MNVIIINHDNNSKVIVSKNEFKKIKNFLSENSTYEYEKGNKK